VLYLYQPTDGEIWFDGKKIGSKESLKEYRRRAQMVFQDPYSSLNPRMTVADIVPNHRRASPVRKQESPGRTGA
jgi:oligopeptide transport system ATP-binding protein